MALRQEVHYHSGPPPSKSYGCFAFLGDVFMTVITCGFWLIYIFVREMRRR